MTNEDYIREELTVPVADQYSIVPRFSDLKSRRIKYGIRGYRALTMNFSVCSADGLKITYAKFSVFKWGKYTLKSQT